MTTRDRRSERAARQRGFTLVELLVVVAMIGVLAALALVGYKKYMRAASSSEATSMIQGIRGAEEAYKAEMLVYLSCSASLTPGVDYYPQGGAITSSGTSKYNWVTNPRNPCWSTLNVTADSPVVFGYAVMAGLPSVTPPTPWGLKSTPVWPSPIVEPWYVVEAIADRDKDGVYAIFLGSSFTGDVYFENDTE
jgi:type IV pilus assembly protein PilA